MSIDNYCTRKKYRIIYIVHEHISYVSLASTSIFFISFMQNKNILGIHVKERDWKLMRLYQANLSKQEEFSDSRMIFFMKTNFESAVFLKQFLMFQFNFHFQPQKYLTIFNTQTSTKSAELIKNYLNTNNSFSLTLIRLYSHDIN